MNAKEIMGDGFIGFDEIARKAGAMKLDSSSKYSLDRFPIPYTTHQLKELRESHFLFFAIPFHKDGTPVTILGLRNIFGCDPSAMEPCFYNQDWYLKEDFVNRPLKPGWYLLSRTLLEETRGKRVDEIQAHPALGNGLPSAVLCTYFFFLSYLVFGRPVWENDYIWNEDTDNKGDQIYTGRYIDASGTNKNGWEIHRHLSIRQNYGTLNVLSGDFVKSA